MIPKSVLEGLKCTLCQNGLSIFPVHSYGARDVYICGRCPLKEDFLPQPEHLYEELAQYIEFPCRYQANGCIERLKPNDLKNHEISCPHKPCLCPILPLGQCRWNGNYDELFLHCQEMHPSFAYEIFTMEIDLVNYYKQNYVFYQGDETFVAQLKSNPKKGQFHCNVRYCGLPSNVRRFCYRVCFMSKKRKYAREIQPVECGETGPIMTATTTSTDFFDIMDSLKHPAYILCKIDIFVKKVEEKEEEEEEETFADEKHLLNIIECPICLEYMVPPIMQCCQGHSFCNSCKNKLTTCPTCKGPINETRNYLLESMTTIINYPCKYATAGCKFSANAQMIKSHESICERKPYHCIIANCSWRDQFPKLMTHLNETHKENILETNSVSYILDPSVTNETCEYIMILQDRIFKVDFIREDKQFSWQSQEKSMNVEYDNYKLVLDFGSRSDERLYVEKMCEPLHIVFNLDHLLNFIIDDNILTYNMRIIESP